jgi:hypothetical protein
MNPTGLLHEHCERSTREAVDGSAGKPGEILVNSGLRSVTVRVGRCETAEKRVALATAGMRCYTTCDGGGKLDSCVDSGALRFDFRVKVMEPSTIGG